MSYTVKSVNGCTRKIEFNFATLDLSKEIKAAVVKKQTTTNIKGFRKGKAPLAMVEQVYGPQIESDALNQFVQSQLFEAVTKEKFKTVGYPAFENVKYETGKSVSFEAVVEIFPEIKLADYSSYSFKKEKAVVTKDDLDKVTKNYLGSKSEMTEVADAKVGLATGHFAVFNFEGVKENGERPENMKGSEYLLEIGSGQFIPGFEDGMIGLKKGEKKNILLTFPADYHAAELQNGKVTFEVELLEIKEKKFPELNDEMAKEFGYESVANFTEKNTTNLLTQKERQASEKLHQDILEKLVKDNKFDVPATLVQNQEKYLQEDLGKNLKSQGFNEAMVAEYFERWKADITTKADFQVRSGLILDHLAQQFNIETSDADFNKKIEESAATAGMDVETVKKYYSTNSQIKNNLMYAIREEKTFEEIKKKIKIS
ncbi:MAG: trigger factor [Bacteriovorax sp.]|nr:trigger factor [Bacteriovorax sp.]